MTDSDSAPPEKAPRRVGRLVFLGTVGAGISSLYWGNDAWRSLSKVLGPVEAQIPLIPQGGWRIYTVSGTMPAFDPEQWRLEVTGHVKTSFSLDYRGLLALPKVEQVSTFHCVTGWTVANVHWSGVRLSDVLSVAAPTAEARAVEFESAEAPYVDSLTLKQAQLHDVVLAYEMNGVALSREHGAPVRLVIPEMYGYKNVKWLKKITLTSNASPGYWEKLGYDVDAWIGHSNGYGISPARQAEYLG